MSIQKRRLATFLTIILSLSFIFKVNASEGNKNITKIANVVYFIKFSDSKSNFMDGKFEDVKDIFQGEKNISLTNYIKTISYNQMNVHNYYPQEVNNNINLYTMSNNRSYYNKYNEYEMIEEVLKNVSVNPNYNVDMNDDGYVDNVIFVFDGKVTEKDDVLWSHKSNYNGNITINNKMVNNYNIHNSYSLIESSVSGREGVLAHEFLHSVGYPDLYRAAADGAPVGRWDIMSSVSVFLQYPLAYTRSAISNWFTIDTITESGSYKLKPSSSAKGDRAFILKTPMSDKEFFVIEYRKQGSQYKWELDSKIPGSGLIIYRVNTEERSNYVGDKDYIYIFRPGETKEGGGKGNLSEAFLSQQFGRTSYGSDDFNKTIADNAITYSTGRNSGIVIENVSEAGEEISFDIKFTDTSVLGIWDIVGNEVISNKADSNIAMDVSSNKIYTVYNDGDSNRKMKSKMFDGTKWIDLSEGGIQQAGSDPKIKLYNGIPYVLYHDNKYRSVVMKFEDNRWEVVGVLTNKISQYSDIIATENGLYVAYTDSGTNILKVSKLNLNTNKFELVGDIVHKGYITHPSIAENNGVLYISYNDFFDNNRVYVKKYEDNKWNNIDGLNLRSSYTTMKLYGERLYIGVLPVFGKSDSEVYSYQDGVWNKVGESIAGNGISDLKIDINKGTPYVAYVDNLNKEVIVKYYDGYQWVKEGESVSDEGVSKINFSIKSGKAYLATNGYNSRNFLVKSKQLSTGILEDINGDGKIDLLDLYELAEKYNISAGDDKYKEELDINKDGIIDIYDIVIIANKI